MLQASSETNDSPPTLGGIIEGLNVHHNVDPKIWKSLASTSAATNKFSKGAPSARQRVQENRALFTRQSKPRKASKGFFVTGSRLRMARKLRFVPDEDVH